MQPLFSIHAGEYLVGSYIQENVREANGNKFSVSRPFKNAGTDLFIA